MKNFVVEKCSPKSGKVDMAPMIDVSDERPRFIPTRFVPLAGSPDARLSPGLSK